MSGEPEIKRPKKGEDSKEEYCQNWVDNSKFKKPSLVYSPRKSVENSEDDYASDISRASSYSQFDRLKSEKELKITFADLNKNSKPADKFIQHFMKNDNIFNLKSKEKQNQALNKIYENLINKFRLYEFPGKDNFELTEYYLHDLTSTIFEPVLICFKDVLDEKELTVRREGNLQGVNLVPKKKATHGRMEFIIKIEKRVETNRELNKFHFITSNLVVIEVKKDDIVQGQAQCLVALRDAYDSNSNKRMVFGIVTTVKDWRFILYNGVEFLLSELIENVIYSDMKFKKDEWLKGSCVSIYKLLFAIFCTSLSEDEPKQAYLQDKKDEFNLSEVVKKLSGLNSEHLHNEKAKEVIRQLEKAKEVIRQLEKDIEQIIADGSKKLALIPSKSSCGQETAKE